MNPGGISVERTLPIDSALLGDVLLRLRRDSSSAALRWTLGDLGAAEIDVCFASVGAAWTADARLWNPSGRAVTTASVRIEGSTDDEIRIVLDPTAPATPSARGGAEWPELARAALDELAEELLWHATRTGLTARG